MASSTTYADPATTLIPTTPGSLQIDYLERTVGVYFIGYIFTMVLYGFTFFQGYMYYSRYPKDNWKTKAFVALIVMLDTALSGLLSETLYYYVVSLFLFTRGVELATINFCAQFELSVIVVFLVQLFYAWSIWQNSRRAVMSGATALLSTVSLVFGTLTTVQLLKDPQFAHMSNNPTKAFLSIAQGLAAAAAILSTLGLSTGSSPKGFRPFESVFDILVGYGVSYGGACVILQVGYTFVFVGAPDKHYWIPFHFVATKFFVISAITYLNTRRSSLSANPDSASSNAGTKDEWASGSRGFNLTHGSTHMLSTTGSVNVVGQKGRDEIDMKPVVITVREEDESIEKEEEAFRVKSGEYDWTAR